MCVEMFASLNDLWQNSHFFNVKELWSLSTCWIFSSSVRKTLAQWPLCLHWTNWPAWYFSTCVVILRRSEKYRSQIMHLWILLKPLLTLCLLCTLPYFEASNPLWSQFAFCSWSLCVSLLIATVWLLESFTLNSAGPRSTLHGWISLSGKLNLTKLANH